MLSIFRHLIDVYHTMHSICPTYMRLRLPLPSREIWMQKREHKLRKSNSLGEAYKLNALHKWIVHIKWIIWKGFPPSWKPGHISSHTYTKTWNKQQTNRPHSFVDGQTFLVYIFMPLKINALVKFYCFKMKRTLDRFGKQKDLIYRSIKFMRKEMHRPTATF